MFGRKDDMSSASNTAQNHETTTQNQTTTPRATIAETPRVSQGPITGRHHMEKRRPAPEPMHSSEERKLIVGKGLSLSGEIAACDILVVEGKVEAKLSDGKLLEITETGQFTGAVEIQNADIAGRYDGDLTVHGRLTIRGTGRISGIVKYGELEVNAGGQVIGEMQVVGGGKIASGTPPNLRKGGKFTANPEDDATEDNGEALFSRKTANG